MLQRIPAVACESMSAPAALIPLQMRSSRCFPSSSSPSTGEEQEDEDEADSSPRGPVALTGSVLSISFI